MATGSARRRTQLAALCPDVDFVELRGNIDTRLGRLADVDAIIMAAAALVRLEYERTDTTLLTTEQMIPQVGQGTLAVEARADDAATAALLDGVNDAESAAIFTIERGFLLELGGDCDLPAGAHAATDADGVTHVRAFLASEDGTRLERAEATGTLGDVGLAAALAAELRDRLSC